MHSTATTPAPKPANAWSYIGVMRRGVMADDGVLLTIAGVGKVLGGCCDMQSLGLANGTQRSGRGAGDWRESERSLHHQCPKEAIDKIRWGYEGESATRCHQRRRRRATVSVASHSATNNVAEVCRVFCDASSAPAVVLITLAPCIVAYRKEIRSR